MKKIFILFSFLIAALAGIAQHGTFTDIRLVNGDSTIAGSANGRGYYNTVSNKFRFYQNGTWNSFVRLEGTYSNPSWLSALPITKITGLGSGWASPLAASLGTGWAAVLNTTYSSGALTNGSGTTADGTAVDLGGDLSQTTSLAIHSGTGERYFEIISDLADPTIYTSFQSGIFDDGFSSFAPSTQIISVSGDNSTAISFLSNTLSMSAVDGVIHNGLVVTSTSSAFEKVVNYGSDVSASYTTRSHIDKGYADSRYGIGTASGLTRTNDTNVTLTLGGTPATSLLQATSLTLGWTGTLGVARGGTAIASYAVGDIIYASGSTTLSKLADVATGNALISGGVTTAPSWGKITSSHVDATVQTAGLSYLLASGGTASAANTITLTSSNTWTFSAASLSTTLTPIVYFTNPTAAGAGAQQTSPAEVHSVQAWKTNSTAGNQTVLMGESLLGVQGTANPTGVYKWSSNVNAAGWSDLMYLDSRGYLGIGVTPSLGSLHIKGQSGIDIFYAQGTAANGVVLEDGGFTFRPISSGNTANGTTSRPWTITYSQRLIADNSGAGATTGTTLQSNPLAYTNSTASTERIDNYFNSTRSVNFNAGSMPLQRFTVFGTPTITANGASAFTRNVNVSISGAPITSTNVTTTTAIGLEIETSNVASATTAYGAFINAPTGATTNWALGISGNVNVAGSIISTGTASIITGTATNDAAASGKIGEEINSNISSYTNFTTTATYQNITSITLTAGDWDISAFYTYSSNSATITAASNAIFAISTTTASAAGTTEGLSIAYVPQAALLGTSKFSDVIGPYRVSLSGTTTYYLNAQAAFTVGNPQYVGEIRARRIR